MAVPSNMAARGATVTTTRQAEAELHALNPGTMSRRAEAVLPSRRAFPPALLQMHRLTECNSFCVDCGRREDGVGENEGSSMRLAWANVSYGTTLCGKCALSHLSFDDKDSTIVNVETGQWTLPYVISMLEGGNNSFLIHLKHSGDSLASKDLEHRYKDSKSAAAYRLILAEKTEWSLKAQGYATPKPIKPSAKSIAADCVPAYALSKERTKTSSVSEALAKSRSSSSSAPVKRADTNVKRERDDVEEPVAIVLRPSLKKEESRRFSGPVQQTNNLDRRMSVLLKCPSYRVSSSVSPLSNEPPRRKSACVAVPNYAKERADEANRASVSSIRRKSATHRSSTKAHDSAAAAVASPLGVPRHSGKSSKREPLGNKATPKKQSGTRRVKMSHRLAAKEDYTYLGHGSLSSLSARMS